MASMLSYLIAQPDAYTTEDTYRTFIYSLAKYLRDDPGTRIVDIPAEDGYLYRFDLTQFLLQQNVALEDHYLIQVMNGITSINAIDENIKAIFVPQAQLVASLKQIYRTALVAS
jgi:hypothetical protein